MFCLLSSFFLSCFVFLFLFLFVNFSRMAFPGTTIGRCCFAVCREVLNRRMREKKIQFSDLNFKNEKLIMALLIHARTHSLTHKCKGKVFGKGFANSFWHYYITCGKICSRLIFKFMCDLNFHHFSRLR